jgi:hypothetical protein
MSETQSIPFEEFPHEVILEIFEHLNYDDLKNFCLVSFYWNEVISTSKNFLERTKLKIQIPMKFDTKFSRNYQWMEIGDQLNNGLDDIIVEEIVKISDSLKYLKIHDMIIYGEHLNEILKSCCNLEKLEFSNVRTCDSQMRSKNQIFEMSSLKSLSILSSDWVLNLFECKKLDFLFISRDYGNEFDDQDHVVKFMNKLTKCDTIILSGINFEADVELLPLFTWKHLKLSDVFLPDSGFSISRMNWKNLTDSASEDAKVSLEYFFSSQFISNFLNDFEKIKHLKFDINILPPSDDETFFVGLRKMNSVKSLKIRKYSKNEVVADDRVNWFLEKFPNVEKLDFDLATIHWFTVELVPIVFNRVRILKLEKFTEEMIRLKFPQLETLEIASFSSDDCNFLKHFGESHEKLTKFKANLNDMFRFYGSLTFLRLYMYMLYVDQFEIYEVATKTNYIRTRGDIELKEFGKVLSHQTRMKIQQEIYVKDEEEDE